MLRRIVIYGVIGALIVGAFMVAGTLTWADGGQTPPENGVVVGYLTQLVALAVVFIGVKAHRDNALGGVIKFFPAFGVGVAIAAIASLGWVIAWEIVLTMTKLDFPALMRESMLAEAQARGASEAEIQKVIADADGLAKMYGVAPVRWAITYIEMFPVGVLVSLICAALLRNSRFMPARPAAA